MTPYKVCPKCGQACILTMTQCGRCGFVYPLVVPVAPAPPAYSPAFAPRKRVWPLYLLAVLVIGAFIGGVVWLNRPARVTIAEIRRNNIAFNGKAVALRGNYRYGDTSQFGRLEQVLDTGSYVYGGGSSSEFVNDSDSIKLTPAITGISLGDEIEVTGVYNAHMDMLLVQSFTLLKRREIPEFQP